MWKEKKKSIYKQRDYISKNALKEKVPQLSTYSQVLKSMYTIWKL